MVQKISIWIAILLTLGYLLIKTFLSLGLYELVAVYVNNTSLRIELSELITTVITLCLLTWFLLKKKAFNEEGKATRSYSQVKLIVTLIIIVIGIRLIEDPILRYKNILLNEPLLDPNNMRPFSMTTATLINLLNIIIFLPILEELFFRKLIFKGLFKNHSSLILALLTSSILFAVSHFSLANALPTFIFGMISAFIYHRTNNILHSILLHVFSNLIWLALIIDPNNYYWKIQNYLNFNTLYWLVVVFGMLLILIPLKYVIKSPSNY